MLYNNIYNEVSERLVCVMVTRVVKTVSDYR